MRTFVEVCSSSYLSFEMSRICRETLPRKLSGYHGSQGGVQPRGALEQQLFYNPRQFPGPGLYQAQGQGQYPGQGQDYHHPQLGCVSTQILYLHISTYLNTSKDDQFYLRISTGTVPRPTAPRPCRSCRAGQPRTRRSSTDPSPTARPTR